MPLTEKDILEKTFKRSFKGYNENEVDKFLDKIIDEFRALSKENASLKAAAEENAYLRGKLSVYEQVSREESRRFD